MSTGFSNNNPGNINYYGGQPFEGATGITVKTADGQNNVQFEDIVYGLRALMQVIDNDIENKHYNLYQLAKNYTGKTDPGDISNYCSVINEYANTDFDISPTAPPLQATIVNILTIAKGIVQNEIPEYNQITPDQWTQALQYYVGQNYDYTVSNDNRPGINKTNIADNTAGLNMFVVLALIGAGIYFFTKR